MAAPRILCCIVSRVSSSALRSGVTPRQRLRVQYASSGLTLARSTQLVQRKQVRWQSQASSGGESKVYEFKDVEKLISAPSSNRVLIDTREPAELDATGRIPTAVNIPITSSPDAFFLSEDEFEDRFGFARPGKEIEVVFYCKAGVRSRAAARLATQAGWEKVGEYAGSWVDWEGRGGQAEK